MFRRFLQRDADWKNGPRSLRVGANGMGRGPCRLGPFRPQDWGQMRKKVTEITDTAGPPQSKCLAQDNKSWTGQGDYEANELRARVINLQAAQGSRPHCLQLNAITRR